MPPHNPVSELWGKFFGPHGLVLDLQDDQDPFKSPRGSRVRAKGLNSDLDASVFSPGLQGMGCSGSVICGSELTGRGCVLGWKAGIIT